MERQIKTFILMLMVFLISYTCFNHSTAYETWSTPKPRKISALHNPQGEVIIPIFEESGKMPDEKDALTRVQNKETAQPKVRIETIVKAEKCSSRQTIVYLKTHKTGSTTLSRLVERYGYKHSLSFVRKIGERGSIHYGNRRFNNNSVRGFLPPHNVSKGDYSNYKFNIFSLHVRYDRDILDGFMKENPIHITVLREPSKQFESAFSFFGISRYIPSPKPGVSKMQLFLSNPKKYPRAASKCYANNDQIFDLGLNQKYVRNETAINETITRLDQDMDLVLINEFYDESLVLMSKILCWSLEDVLYLPVNERPDSKKTAMSEELREKARKWNHADTILYNYFVERLHRRITEYGPSFEADLGRFRNMTAEVRRNCVGGQVIGKRRMTYAKTANISKECDYFTEGPAEMDKRIRKMMGAPKYIRKPKPPAPKKTRRQRVAKIVKQY